MPSVERALMLVYRGKVPRAAAFTNPLSCRWFLAPRRRHGDLVRLGFSTGAPRREGGELLS